MQAKKFSLKMKEGEDCKEFNAHSAESSTLKFHGIKPSAELKLAEVASIEDEIAKIQMDIESELIKAEPITASAPAEPLKLVEEEAVVIADELVVEQPAPKTKKLALKDDDGPKKAQKKKFSNQHYFGVKNHLDLFEVGKHYSNAFQDGMKSFAFHSDQKKCVQHSILGIASFFNYHKGVKAVIFVDKFEGSELSALLKPTHVEMELLSAESEDDVYEVYSCDGVDIVEMDKLKHLALKMGTEAFHEFLAKIVKESEVLFWDLPEAKSINREREFYLPIFNVINSLSLVVDTGKTKINQVKEMHTFAGKYQVAVDGVLMYKNPMRS